MKKGKTVWLLIIMVLLLLFSCIFERKQKQDNNPKNTERTTITEQPDKSGSNIKDKSSENSLSQPPESKDPVIKVNPEDTVGVY